jgi:hypothetical protein
VVRLPCNGTGAIANLSLKNNTVAAPLAGVRPGIRLDAGNASAGSDDAVCLDIAGNTTAGTTSSGTTTAGIGLRKQGSVSDHARLRHRRHGGDQQPARRAVRRERRK